MDDAEDEIRSSEKAGFRYEKRAMTKHPVVEALEQIKDYQNLVVIAYSQLTEAQDIAREALPLAQELVEKASALDWLIKRHYLSHMLSVSDLPAVIKKYLENKHE